MAYRGFEPGPGDPGVEHRALVIPGMVWPGDGRITLREGSLPLVRSWRFLMFEVGGTILIEDEQGVVLPYTRFAGDVLPLCGTAIVQAAAHGIPGQPTATSTNVLVYGLR